MMELRARVEKMEDGREDDRQERNRDAPSLTQVLFSI